MPAFLAGLQARHGRRDRWRLLAVMSAMVACPAMKAAWRPRASVPAEPAPSTTHNDKQGSN